MKKPLLYLASIAIIFIGKPSIAQSYEWAFTTSKAPRTNVTALRKEHAGDFYLSTFTDSTATRLYSTFEKRDANQQFLWQKQIMGDVTIADIEINAANHAIVTGYFSGIISIDGNVLSATPTAPVGFIFETDETGLIQWINTLNPTPNIFRPVDLFIANNGFMFLTSEISGNEGFCAFHKLNPQGFIVANEFNWNFDNRTYSNILVDTIGNIYISGTCGNTATFDTINANSNFSYQNFLVKYDSLFNAQWFMARNYITFDHNNKLGTDGASLYWAFSDFTSSVDTVRIIKAGFNGQINTVVSCPNANSFFPGIDYSVDRFGNSTLVIAAFTRLFVYRYDPAFTIIWQDTLMTQISGFPLQTDLICYDSCFYLTSIYVNDTLIADNFTMFNPNIGTNYPSDVFVSKWSYTTPTYSQELSNSRIPVLLYPNPCSDYLYLDTKADGVIFITDITGKLIMQKQIEPGTLSQTKIDVRGLSEGIYFLKLQGVENKTEGIFKYAVVR